MGMKRRFMIQNADSSPKYKRQLPKVMIACAKFFFDTFDPNSERSKASMTVELIGKALGQWWNRDNHAITGVDSMLELNQTANLTTDANSLDALMPSLGEFL